jgi:hypothetical protein
MFPRCAEEEAIGYVRKVERPAFVVRHGLRRTASIGYSVFMNDLFTTGKTGAMGITFKDNTMVSIGPDTEFVVDEFVSLLPNFHPSLYRSKRRWELLGFGGHGFLLKLRRINNEMQGSKPVSGFNIVFTLSGGRMRHAEELCSSS